MYLQHFNLNGRPFADQTGDGFFTPNGSVAIALARVQQVLMGRDSIAVITGGPGVGKSALAERAHDSIADQSVVANADLRQTDPEILYDLLLASLGEKSTDGNMALALSRLYQATAKHNADGRKVTAVIDVNSLSADGAKRILRLAHFSGQPGAQLNIILQGPHTLQKVIDVRGLIHLRQRVACRHNHRPLTLDETEGYIRHRLTATGADQFSVIDRDVPATVFGFVAGVPRLINTIMESALSEAFIQNKEQVTGKLVREVATRLGWKMLDNNRTSVAKRLLARATEAKLEKTAGPAAGVANIAATNGETPALTRTQSTPLHTTPANDSSGQVTGPEVTEQPTAAALVGATPKKPPTAVTPGQLPPASPGPEADNHLSLVPAMNPKDTGATGMLKLEDLDARFAETIFGDDTGMFNALAVKDEEKSPTDN
jgi:general secretion pathway protein A